MSFDKEAKAADIPNDQGSSIVNFYKTVRLLEQAQFVKKDEAQRDKNKEKKAKKQEMLNMEIEK